jgi:hypothetical protein
MSNKEWSIRLNDLTKEVAKFIDECNPTQESQATDAFAEVFVDACLAMDEAVIEARATSNKLFEGTKL